MSIDNRFPAIQLSFGRLPDASHAQSHPIMSDQYGLPLLRQNKTFRNGNVSVSRCYALRTLPCSPPWRTSTYHLPEAHVVHTPWLKLPSTILPLPHPALLRLPLPHTQSPTLIAHPGAVHPNGDASLLQSVAEPGLTFPHPSPMSFLRVLSLPNKNDNSLSATLSDSCTSLDAQHSGLISSRHTSRSF